MVDGLEVYIVCIRVYVYAVKGGINLLYWKYYGCGAVAQYIEVFFLDESLSKVGVIADKRGSFKFVLMYWPEM